MFDNLSSGFNGVCDAFGTTQELQACLVVVNRQDPAHVGVVLLFPNLSQVYSRV